jgi:hypothetical protein
MGLKWPWLESEIKLKTLKKKVILANNLGCERLNKMPEKSEINASPML